MMKKNHHFDGSNGRYKLLFTQLFRKSQVIILFGNQVSSIVLDEKISVSQVRKKCFKKDTNGTQYKFYSVYYPVGNGRFNIDKSIEDIKWIINHEIIKK